MNTLAVLTAVLLTAEPSAQAPKQGEVVAEARAWHQKRIERLTAEGGWLSLVGLHWLREGENTVGSKGRVRLPDSLPAELGVFALKGDQVTFTPRPEARVTLKGTPFKGGKVASDAKGAPDELQVGSVTFYVVQRGDRTGIRVKDANAPARVEFKGIGLYPPSERWRLEGTLVASDDKVKVASVAVPTVIGSIEEMPSPGKVRFQIDGRQQELIAVTEEGSDKLFIIFGDATNKTETYGAGRFLYADAPKDGKVVLDFNRAYNPPCAFSAYATCPLPPKGNKLAVRIEAGEKRYEGKH